MENTEAVEGLSTLRRAIYILSTRMEAGLGQ